MSTTPMPLFIMVPRSKETQVSERRWSIPRQHRMNMFFSPSRPSLNSKHKDPSSPSRHNSLVILQAQLHRMHQVFILRKRQL